MASGEDAPLVLVTGASGYIASHVVKLLQDEGYRVRGTVRNLQNEQKVKHLKELAPDARYPLELVEADLTNDDKWAEAIKDCTYVVHTASPFPKAPPAHEDDVVKPAVEGTKRLLKACADAGTVKRVVVTSSISAVHDHSIPPDATATDKTYSESDWSNDQCSTLDAYGKSKILAEKTAWDFVKELPEDKKFELAVINPGIVFGPVIDGTVNTSVEVVKRLMERSMPMVPKVNFCVCDVRDVAQAHLKAMTLPDAADHRHLVFTQNVWMKDIALTLAKEFRPQGYSIPTAVAPYFAMWLHCLVDKTARLLLPRVGREFKYENKRMKEVLGITPRDLSQTILDTAYSLIEKGLVKRTKKFKQGKKDGEEQPSSEGEAKEAKEETPDKDKKDDAEPAGDQLQEDTKVEEEKKEKLEELEPEDKPEKTAEESVPKEIGAIEN